MNGPEANGAIMRQTLRPPLIFISHDSRDARLAKAFRDLLLKVSEKGLKSFLSSEIDFGKDWYEEIKENLRAATDVVCLLTSRSVNSRWVLFEAGMAKGRPKTPVRGVALGISKEVTDSGPFGQLQNCHDEDGELEKLLGQLIRDRLPDLMANAELIAGEVKTFRDFVAKALQESAADASAEPALPPTLQRLLENWKAYRQTNPKDPGNEDFRLHSFCGLDDNYDWSSSSEMDLEDVYYLWADAGSGSSIKASVLRDDSQAKRLEIRFDTKPAGHVGSVALRLKGRSLVQKSGGFEELTFSARIPPSRQSDDLTEVQLGIRIIDALKTHWICSYLEGYRPLYVNNRDTDQWQKFSVHLKRGGWQVFATDGNSLYHDIKPDFSKILALIVELGSRNALRSGPGKGVVELKDLEAK